MRTRKGRCGARWVWWAVGALLAWNTSSMGQNVTLQVQFPEDQQEAVAEATTETRQQQALTLTFESLALPPIVPQIAQGPEMTIEEVEVEGQKEERQVSIRRPLEIAAKVEAGRLELEDEDGTQVASRAVAQYTWESGFSLYGNLGFEYFDLDDIDGDGTGYLLNLGVSQELWDELVKVGTFFTWRFTETTIEDAEQDVHSFGGGLLVAGQRTLGPVILSGGLIYQFLQDTGDLDRDNHILSYGLGLGLPIGQRLVVSVQAFQINDLERDEDPVVVGSELTYFVTPRWGFTLGWKTILNVEDYTSHEGTLGASARF